MFSVWTFQDVQTRWNSTLLMLRRFIRLRWPVLAVLNDEDMTKRAKKPVLLSDAEWDMAATLVSTLEDAEVTKQLSGESYVTMSLVVPLLSTMRDELRKEDDERALNITLFLEKMADEITRRFKLDAPKPSLQILAAALDPRFRSLHFCSEEQREAVKAELEQDLICKATAPSSPAPADEPTSSAGTEEPAPPPKKKRSLLSRACQSSMASTQGRADPAEQVREEVSSYMKEPPLPETTDPLLWWKFNASRFPSVARLAQNILAIPASSTTPERTFSAAGVVTSGRRARLSAENVNAILFLNKNTDFSATVNDCN